MLLTCYCASYISTLISVFPTAISFHFITSSACNAYQELLLHRHLKSRNPPHDRSSSAATQFPQKRDEIVWRRASFIADLSLSIQRQLRYVIYRQEIFVIVRISLSYSTSNKTVFIVCALCEGYLFCHVKGEGKVFPVRFIKPYMGVDVKGRCFNLSTRWAWMVNLRLWQIYPVERTPIFFLNKRLVSPRGKVVDWRREKSLAPAAIHTLFCI
jgi:hypothetical protein